MASARRVGLCAAHGEVLHEVREETCVEWAIYFGKVVCEHSPDAHPLDDDGLICRFPRKAVAL